MSGKRNMQIDRTDLRILHELSRDARQSLVDLAERIGLSTTAIARRQKSLEDAGVIQSYHLGLDLRQLGYSLTVLVRITLDSQSDEALRSFESGVSECPAVTRCFLMSGTDDYLALVVAKDIDDFERIHRTELSRLPRVSRIQSSFAIRDVVQRPAPLSLFQPVAVTGKKRGRA
jgi:Lrp/AsnC family transcriptional regulator, leucine-responsive regulatory protein